MGDVRVYLSTTRIKLPEPMVASTTTIPFPKGFAGDIYTAICEPRQRRKIEGVEQLDHGYVMSALNAFADPPCGRGTKDCPKGYILVMLYTAPPPVLDTGIPPLENAVGIAVASLGNYEGRNPTLGVRLLCSSTPGGGPTLLSILEQIARENGATHLILTPVDAAKGWYEKRGFVESAGYLRRPVPGGGSRRTRRRRKGGKRLAQGTQNAVFTIPFPCDEPLRRETVMLVSLSALNGGEPSRRPLPAVLDKLRAIDPKAERFYYPLACSVRAPLEGEPIEESLKGLSQSERERLIPFIDIVPYGPNGTLKSRPAPPGAREILLADIKFLHINGIAHGDVSKDNVVFDKADRPHLIDFGQSSLRVGDDGVSVPKGFETTFLSWAAMVKSDLKDLDRILPPAGARRRTRRTRARRFF